MCRVNCFWNWKSYPTYMLTDKLSTWPLDSANQPLSNWTYPVDKYFAFDTHCFFDVFSFIFICLRYRHRGFFFLCDSSSDCSRLLAGTRRIQFHDFSLVWAGLQLLCQSDKMPWFLGKLGHLIGWNVSMTAEKVASTFFGWPNGDKLALTCMKIWTHSNTMQVHASRWPNGMQVRASFKTCTDLHRLASPFGQGLMLYLHEL